MDKNKRVLSYSLWGKNPKYTIGAIANADDAKLIYPDFEVRFYVDGLVPTSILYSLIERGAIVIKVNAGISEGWSGLFWRYLPALESDVKVLISRDTDSRLSEREAVSVAEWLKSGASLHIMRDHPGHYMPIQGGLCGFQTKSLSKLSGALTEAFTYKAPHYYNLDQAFLAKWMWEFIINKDCYINDEIFENKSFSVIRTNSSFIGESFNEYGEVNPEHREILRRWLYFKEICPDARLDRNRDNS